MEMQQEAQPLLREKTRVLGELRDARGENVWLIERVALLESWKKSGYLERDRLDMSVRCLEIENDDLRELLDEWEAAGGGPSMHSMSLRKAVVSPLPIFAGATRSSFAGRTPLAMRMISLADDKENSPGPKEARQSGPSKKGKGFTKGLQYSTVKKSNRPPLGDVGNAPEQRLASYGTVTAGVVNEKEASSGCLASHCPSWVWPTK